MRINNTETYLEPVSVSVDLVCSRTINQGRIGESSECTESFISNNKKNITVKSYLQWDLIQASTLYIDIHIRKFSTILVYLDEFNKKKFTKHSEA